MENVDFSLVLLVAVVVTGVLWFFDKLVTAKRRTSDDPEPWWVDYGAGFFPVLFVVFALEAFSTSPTRSVRVHDADAGSGRLYLGEPLDLRPRTPVTGETFTD